MPIFVTTVRRSHRTGRHVQDVAAKINDAKKKVHICNTMLSQVKKALGN
jgi:uncharacterized protein YeeX (DUF496 family)